MFWQMSENVLGRFKRLHPLLWNTECDLEQALIYWELGERERAMHVMKRCMAALESRALQVSLGALTGWGVWGTSKLHTGRWGI